MNSIVINDLKVRRGGNLVLPGISLEVPAGTVTGLLGPSGSGKTTLMRAIVGVQIVDSGEVRVLGEPAGTPPLRRRVAYLTQAPSVGSPAASGRVRRSRPPSSASPRYSCWTSRPSDRIRFCGGTSGTLSTV